MLMGLRREPQPPMPIVMPSRSSATTSSSVMRLSLIVRCLLDGIWVAALDERVAQLVGHAGQVELEGEALLVAVRTLHVPQVDAVEALFRSPDDGGRLLGDRGGHRERGVAQFVAPYHLEHGTERVELGRGGGRARA